MSNSTILVTGGAGYIGSHVCKMLSGVGFTPVTYDNLGSGNIEAVQWGPLEIGDVCDRARLKDVMERYKPQAIMHFAAKISVRESVENPAIYYENNVYGSLCLLREALANGIKHMVFSSTAAVYGMPGISPIPETTALDPINPYGQTKLAMERMIRDFSGAYGLKYAILRYFNAAGADSETMIGSAYPVDTHIIPLLTRAASGMIPQFTLFGTDYATRDGTAVRDYIGIEDLAEAHILALKHILSGKDNITTNIGTSRGYSVQEIVDAARRITGVDIPVATMGRREGDPAELVADSALAQKTLGWKPERSDLDTIIGTAWKWRLAQNDGIWQKKTA